LTRSSLWTGK